MKPYSSFTLSRWQNIGLRALVACIAFLAVGPIGLLAAALNPDGWGTPLLGVYPQMNVTTKVGIVAQNAKNAQELWARYVTYDDSTMRDINPFADNMTSNAKMSGGKMTGGILNKAIMNVKDTTVVQGNTVNIPTRAALAGEGVQGEGMRDGQEQVVRAGSFPVLIGRKWFGAGTTTVAQDETMIGSYWDQEVAEDLRAQVSCSKRDDILFTMMAAAGLSGRNYLLPDGIAARANLTASNVFNTSLITKINSRLQSNGGAKMNLARDASGSAGSKYIILGTADGLRPLEVESAYLDGIKEAGVRGDDNPLFDGGLVNWFGTGLYRWEQVNHAGYGPVGSPLLPRAFLGAELDVSGTTTGLIVQGGGSAEAAAVTPTPKYFKYFSNALYTFTNGNTIAAVTNVNRYIKVTNQDGTSAVLKYATNSGTTITLPVSSVQTVSGSTATTLTVGALIEECNATGIVFVRHIGLAAKAVVTGAGSIKGTNGATGRRTMQVRNNELEYTIGIEYAWGCAAFKRPDNVYPGFIVLETAMPSAAS